MYILMDNWTVGGCNDDNADLLRYNPGRVDKRIPRYCIPISLNWHHVAAAWLSSVAVKRAASFILCSVISTHPPPKRGRTSKRKTEILSHALQVTLQLVSFDRKAHPGLGLVAIDCIGNTLRPGHWISIYEALRPAISFHHRTSYIHRCGDQFIP